jgi:hypothetical protein
MSNRARQTSDTSTKTTSTARKRKSQETFDGDEHDRCRRPRSTYDQMDIDEKPDITKLDAPSTGSSTVVPVAGPSRGVSVSRGTVLSMRPTSFKKMERRPDGPSTWTSPSSLHRSLTSCSSPLESSSRSRSLFGIGLFHSLWIPGSLFFRAL